MCPLKLTYILHTFQIPNWISNLNINRVGTYLFIKIIMYSIIYELVFYSEMTQFYY